MPIPSWHPAIALADLRIRQGLLADAEALLVGKDAHVQALLPVARLHLARGEVDLALATASRGLRMVGPDRLRGVELLALVAEAQLATSRVEAAKAACDELMDRARGLDVPRLRAQASRAQALLLAASGDLAEAISTMEQALDAVPSGLPVLRVELLLGLVRLHEQAGNRAAAIVEAARATSVLAGLDVALPAGDRALLQRFARTAGPTGMTALLTHDGGVWSVSSDGVRARLPATKGLRYLAELIRAPGVERHVLDLVDAVEGVAVDGPDRHHLGDAGELLDSAARRAYRHQVEELRTAVEEALADGADDRAAALQRQCDELVGQLAAAFGLSGRSRTASSAAERARLNVTRSVRTAVARIGVELPAAGQVLDRRIRTGLYCAFEPAADDPVRWIVQS
jgi:tetratricopeptide (TPR) repeat protein